MTVTVVDPKTALIAIDLQKGIVAIPTAPHSSSEVVKNAALLLSAFRKKALPVVLVNVAGQAPGRVEQPLGGGPVPPDFAEFVAELNKQPSDHIVTKKSWGAFTNTGLEAHLKGLGVTQVVVVGIATSVGVETTARQAYENGFNVTVAVDATSDFAPTSFSHSVDVVFPRLGQTGSTQDILSLINKL